VALEFNNGRRKERWSDEGLVDHSVLILLKFNIEVSSTLDFDIIYIFRSHLDSNLTLFKTCNLHAQLRVLGKGQGKVDPTIPLPPV